MSLVTDGSPYPILLPASKITKYSKLPDWYAISESFVSYLTFYVQIWQFWKLACISETAACRARIKLNLNHME